MLAHPHLKSWHCLLCQLSRLSKLHTVWTEHTYLIRECIFYYFLIKFGNNNIIYFLQWSSNMDNLLPRRETNQNIKTTKKHPFKVFFFNPKPNEVQETRTSSLALSLQKRWASLHLTGRLQGLLGGCCNSKALQVSRVVNCCRRTVFSFEFSCHVALCCAVLPGSGTLCHET